MKITEVKLGILSVPLRVPFKTALRTVNSVEDVILEIYTDTGAVGYGEAPPTGAITGDTTGAIVGAVKDHIAKTLVGRDVDEFEDLCIALDKCIVKNSSAKAAADMALWDLYGQLYNIPVYKLMGGAKKSITTDITISVNEPDEMVRDAINSIERGYDCLKVKVGKEPEKDIARLSAIRGAVPKETCIRIDANQGWSPKEAVRILNGMQEKGLDIEFVEQPVKAHDFEGLKYVTERSYVPVLADESVFSAEDHADEGSGSGEYQADEVRRALQCAEDRVGGGGLRRGVHDRLYAGGEDQCQRGGASGLRETDHHEDRSGRTGTLLRGSDPGRRCV